MDITAQEILAGIRGWVEIESQTADPEGVNRVMSKCAAEYEAAGATVERIPGTEGRGDHLRITSAWGGDGPGILVLCHLDTVHPKGTLAKDLPFRVEGDKAYGPGIYDMKGGAYLALCAYRAIAAGPTPNSLPVRFLYVSDEETGSRTSRALIEQEAERAKYVLVTEPARDGGRVVTGRKGVGRYVMRARGRPSHAGSKHEEGRNAIVEIARHVAQIDGWTDYGRGITFNIGMMNGGTAENVVPEHCMATIDMRVRSIADGQEMDRRLKALKAHNPDIQLTIEGGLNRPPFEKSAGIAALYSHAKGLAAEIGFELHDLATGGGSDGNFTAHKVPTLDGLGVDGAGAHRLDEHLYISSLVPRMLLQKRLMESLA
jgi:glutamate carboxypeptidase